MKREACDLPSLLFFAFPILTSLPTKDISSACEFYFLPLAKICGQPQGYHCKMFLKLF